MGSQRIGHNWATFTSLSLSFSSVSEVKNTFILGLPGTMPHVVALKKIITEVLAKGKWPSLTEPLLCSGNWAECFSLSSHNNPVRWRLLFPCFTVDAIKAQRSKMIHLRSHNWYIFETQRFACKAYIVIHQAVVLCELVGKWINAIISKRQPRKPIT